MNSVPHDVVAAPPCMTASMLRAITFGIGLMLIGTAAGQAGELRLLAPSAPGTGWDHLARTLKDDLAARGSDIEIVIDNVPGAGGTIGLAQFAGDPRDDSLLVTGLAMLDAAIVKRVPVPLDRLTPIARLCSEYYAVVVPAQSPFMDLAGLRAAFLSDPSKIPWAGGPTGSPDHVATALLARTLGVDPAVLNYVPFLATGDAVAAMAEATVAAAFVPETELPNVLKTSKVRVLATASEAGLLGLSAPTLREEGFDLVFANWRGVLARPDIAADRRANLTATIYEIATSPAWQEAIRSRGWRPSFLAGEAFDAFIKTESARVTQALSKTGVLKPPAE